jgi:hypothetical protein
MLYGDPVLVGIYIHELTAYFGVATDGFHLAWLVLRTQVGPTNSMRQTTRPLMEDECTLFVDDVLHAVLLVGDAVRGTRVEWVAVYRLCFTAGLYTLFVDDVLHVLLLVGDTVRGTHVERVAVARSGFTTGFYTLFVDDVLPTHTYIF